MSSVLDKAIARMEGNIINGVDWQQWLHPGDVARVVPVSSLDLDTVCKMVNGKEATDGLTLPWNKTDGKVLIRPGKLAIWTGWSHHGKTQFLKMSMLWACKTQKVLICSMEEEIRDVVTDLVFMHAQGNRPTESAIEDFLMFVNGRLWFYDQQGTVDAKRMQAVLRYAATELGITHAVVDSLMMLSMDREDYDAQSRFVGELKSIAKDTGMTIHLVAHMRKRDGKTGENAPGNMHDIAGGHEIASKADYVFNVWRDKSADPEHDCVLTVEKQRGRINWIGRVGLNYHKPSGQFIDGMETLNFRWDK